MKKINTILKKAFPHVVILTLLFAPVLASMLSVGPGSVAYALESGVPSLTGQINNGTAGSYNSNGGSSPFPTSYPSTVTTGGSNTSLSGAGSNTSLGGSGSNTNLTGSGSMFTNPIQASSLSGLLQAVLKVVIEIGAVVVVFFYIWAGFNFVTARGDSSKISSAIQTLTWTTVGAMVILGAQVIANAINGTVTQLKLGS